MTFSLYVYLLTLFNVEKKQIVMKQGKPLASIRRLSYWEINQATSKCQIDFWTKLAKKV